MTKKNTNEAEELNFGKLRKIFVNFYRRYVADSKDARLVKEAKEFDRLWSSEVVMPNDIRDAALGLVYFYVKPKMSVEMAEKTLSALLQAMPVKETSVFEKMTSAIREKDEKLMESIAIQCMELFLLGKMSKEDLDDLGALYLTVPIHEPHLGEFIFQNTKLRYVLEELSAIEVLTDKRASTVVKKYIAYLKGEDYEAA
jgi:hypothetical protein